MHFLDSYYTWNALRKEVNTVSSNDEDENYESEDDYINFNSVTDESSEYLTRLLIKNILLNPIHPCTEEGMEPYDSFNETECLYLVEGKEIVGKVLMLGLNIMLYCRCLYHNLLASYVISRKASCGVMLKLICRKGSNSNINANKIKFAQNMID